MNRQTVELQDTLNHILSAQIEALAATPERKYSADEVLALV